MLGGFIVVDVVGIGVVVVVLGFEKKKRNIKKTTTIFGNDHFYITKEKGGEQH